MTGSFVRRFVGALSLIPGYLAARSRLGLPLSLPSTTGAPEPMTGGEYWAAA